MIPGDSSKENTIQGMEKGEPRMIDVARRNKTVSLGDGVKSSDRTPRPPMTRAILVLAVAQADKEG